MTYCAWPLDDRRALDIIALRAGGETMMGRVDMLRSVRVGAQWLMFAGDIVIEWKNKGQNDAAVLVPAKVRVTRMCAVCLGRKNICGVIQVE